ncbi:MAG: TonB-dependent receptor [Burkholderiaceae bacterium]|nr:TonB-dependent receptor [Burkholderiaceae bacterium]
MSRPAAICLLAAFGGPALAQVVDPPLQQTVVVSATRHAISEVDAPASISVVTPQDIADRGADNVFEALRGEPGITAIGRTISGRRNVSIRGMEGRHTLYLVDGMRLGNTDGVVGHSDFQYDWVPVQDIARIELVRGPMSVLYGSEALGGVVNVITRVPGDRWSLRAMAEGSWTDMRNGSDPGGDGWRVALSADGPLGEHFRLGASLAATRRQVVAGSVDPRLSDLEGRDKQDASLRLVWLPAPGHQVALETRLGQEDRWAGVRERSGKRRYHQSMHDLERSHSALGWSADWAGPWRASSLLRAYNSRIDVENSRTAGVAPLRPQSLRDDVVEGQGTLAPLAGQFYTAGFELRDEQLQNEALPGGQGGVGHRALFGQAELDLAPGLALTLGVRHDHHEQFGDEFSPRAYAVWKPAPGWVVKGGYGHGFKAPTLKQITPGYVEDEGPYTYFSNPALVPETNDEVEFGAGWDSAALGLQAMLFHNRVDRLIVPRLFGTAAGRGQYVFENIDQAVLKGVELESRWVPPAGWGAGWIVGLNYTYLDARDGSGQRLEKRPRHTLAFSVDWAGGPWRAGLRLEHQADQLIAAAVLGQPMQPLPDLTRLSVQLAFNLARGLDLSFGVENLGNLQLAEKSPLFTWAEPPRTWRAALRGEW